MGPALREGFGGNREELLNLESINERICLGNRSFSERRNSFRAGEVEAALFFDILPVGCVFSGSFAWHFSTEGASVLRQGVTERRKRRGREEARGND